MTNKNGDLNQQEAVIFSEDKTKNIELLVQKDRKPRFQYVIKLWLYIFSSVKVMSAIFLGLFITLSVLQPILAFVWGGYISKAEANINDTIIPSLLLILVYFVINTIIDLLNRYIGLYGGETIEQLAVVQDNRQKELFHSRIFKKIASFSSEYMEIAKINDNINQVFSFASDYWSGASRGVMLQSYAVVAKIVSIVFIVASLYIFNPWLCVIAIVAPLPSLYSMILGQKLQFRFIKDNMKMQRRINYFQELMLSSSAKELKTFGLYDHFYKIWKDLSDEYTRKERKMIKRRTLLNIVNNTIVSLANIGGSIFAIVLMASGYITIGELGAALALTGTLIGDTNALLGSFSTLFSKENQATQFFDLMELPNNQSEGVNCDDISIIEAKDLRYRYPLTTNYILNDVNLNIKDGEKIALVGENGAGKTTFVKLLLGILSPSSGELRINGTQVEEIDPISRYHTTSVVMQDPPAYATFTVGDNIYIGDISKPRNEEEIDSAMAFSGIEGVGKDELLGKDIGGTDLSGGQWQKIAIARAAYRNRNFIVLDEPTSNLDPIAEAEIFNKYISLSRDKTVVFVTHRVSVASLADRIIVFDRGKIVGDGTHDELLNNRQYAKLYEEQAKWYNR